MKIERYEVIVPIADMRGEPSPQAMLATQLLAGERVTVIAHHGAYARVHNEADGYEGFIEAASLAPESAPPTHRVIVPRTLVFPRPDIKAPPGTTLTLGAVLTIAGEEGRFAVTARGAHIIKDHLAPANNTAPDFVAIAETLLHAPYLWGGKSVAGIDCSGLVQLSLAMAGMSAPRDSGPQAKSLGTPLAAGDTPRRGDLLFWPGHAAICCDEVRIIHANGHHMKVIIEDRRGAVTRIEAAGSGKPSIKRL